MLSLSQPILTSILCRCMFIRPMLACSLQPLLPALLPVTYFNHMSASTFNSQNTSSGSQTLISSLPVIMHPHLSQWVCICGARCARLEGWPRVRMWDFTWLLMLVTGLSHPSQKDILVVFLLLLLHSLILVCWWLLMSRPSLLKNRLLD